MQLQKRYTIGKVFRRRKGIYFEDKRSKIESFIPAYKHNVMSQGLVLNGVALATFRLKNGLPYRGLKATRKIRANQILISVPSNLLISTRTAYFSELQPLFLKHADFFLNHEEWEEHILMAYIISEKRKQKKSQWYHFIDQLPNDIDLLLFWTNEKLALLQDPILVKKVKQSLQLYMEAEQQFLKVLHTSPNEFRWAYTNLHTRDFGSQMKYKCLVPFCEYFNHECVDVHIALYPSEQDSQFIENLFTNDELLSVASSSGSDNSQDLDQDIWDFEDCLGDLFLDWSFARATANTTCEIYKLVSSQISQTQQHKKRSEINHKHTDWSEDVFEVFMMKCQNTEQFEKGAQVYFNYGRLSNRELLLRYGISLEYNKYDHVYLRVEYKKYLTLEMQEMCKKSHISFKLKYTNFPIDLIRFCKAVIAIKTNIWDTDSILYIKNINFEIQALDFALELLNDFKTQFKENLGESEKLLSNQDLGYDEYFALIYRLERQRIIKHNIMLINIAKRLFQDGGSLTCIQFQDFETSREVQTNRILIKKYFKLLGS